MDDKGIFYYIKMEFQIPGRKKCHKKCMKEGNYAYEIFRKPDAAAATSCIICDIFSNFLNILIKLKWNDYVNAKNEQVNESHFFWTWVYN